MYKLRRSSYITGIFWRLPRDVKYAAGYEMPQDESLKHFICCAMDVQSKSVNPS